MTISDGDDVIIEYVGRLEDGTLFDTSDRGLAEETGLASEHPDRAYEPLTVNVGEGTVIEGLEEALRGLEEGDSTAVRIPPEKAYGPYKDSRVAEYDRDAFEDMMGDRTLEIGFEVEAKDSGLPGQVTEIKDDFVVVDFNHELAGETLEFEIEVIDVS
ncbi:FKBP-type peptidyl-prolyl cis-trans isomerase [Halovenus sp. HT40]|uniref:FKBP-type peptidyl-prolyl cis-trans isomerase n=1 Tax=Halovenus sp. HT40 TaxID=3126691 RepID=UPI00300F11DF